MSGLWTLLLWQSYRQGLTLKKHKRVIEAGFAHRARLSPFVRKKMRDAKIKINIYRKQISPGPTGGLREAPSSVPNGAFCFIIVFVVKYIHAREKNS